VVARNLMLIADAADEYLYLMNLQGDFRFDIISVLFDQKNNHVLKHIEDAFWPTAG